MQNKKWQNLFLVVGILFIIGAFYFGAKGKIGVVTHLDYSAKIVENEDGSIQINGYKLSDKEKEIYLSHKNHNQSDIDDEKLNYFSIDNKPAIIDTSLLLRGVSLKDGIPSLTNPKFEPISQNPDFKDTLGLYYENNGEARWYPYTIMVWHEIINDNVGGKNIAVTFCPLCGSAVVYDREIKDVPEKGYTTTLHFGVSGLLYESNLVMYDKELESLWVQALGRAVVGELTGVTLDILPFQLLTKEEVIEKNPNTKSLSRDTGYNRDYGFYPYGDYDGNDEFIFPTSFVDESFHPKKIMYVVPFEDKYIAIPYEDIEDINKNFTIGDSVLYLEKVDGEVNVYNDKNRLPGYYEMWFSFSVHHISDGVVWK